MARYAMQFGFNDDTNQWESILIPGTENETTVTGATLEDLIKNAKNYMDTLAPGIPENYFYFEIGVDLRE